MSGIIGVSPNMKSGVIRGGGQDDAWHCQATATTNWGSGGDEVIDFAGVTFLGKNLTESGGVITVGRSGLYWIAWHVSNHGSIAGVFNLMLRVDAQAADRDEAIDGARLYLDKDGVSAGTGPEYLSQHAAVALQVEAGSTLDIFGSGYFQGTTGQNTGTWFSGCRVG